MSDNPRFVHHLSEYSFKYLLNMEKIRFGKGKGWEIGEPAFDFFTFGFKPGQFVVIGARPSVGKTAIALWMAYKMALKGIPVGFLSMEMDAQEVLDRIIAMDTQVDSKKLNSGFWTNAQEPLIKKAIEGFSKIPFYLSSEERLSTEKIKKEIEDNPAKLVFVDYIQLIRNKSSQNRSRADEVEEISRELKVLAKEQKKCIVALSQLTRDSEGQKPTLADLRQSGALEQDANIVILLHGERGQKKREIIFAKNRGGTTGSLTMRYEPEFNMFYSDREE